MHHTRAIIAALLCSLAAAAGGCHLIFPFNETPGQDTDAGRQDQRTAADLLPLDAGRRDQRPADGPVSGEASPPDAPTPDALVPDAPLDPCNPTGTCHECEPLQNPGCSTRSCGAGLDCDDLPDHRDPWTSTCDTVLFEDDFADPTLAKWSKLFAGGSIHVKTCGLLQIDPPTHTTAVAAVKTPMTQNFLLEVGLTTPPLQNPWTIDVLSLMEEYSKQRLDCRLEYTPTKTLRLTTWVTGPTGGYVSGQGKQLGALAGQVVLQGWRSGANFTCRIFQGGVKLGEDQATIGGAFKSLGGITLQVITPQYMPPALARFDFVRAFSAP